MKVEYWRRDFPRKDVWTLTLSSEDEAERAAATPGKIGWLEDGTEFRVVKVDPDDRFPGKVGILAESARMLAAHNQKATFEPGAASEWFISRARSMLPGGVYGIMRTSILNRYLTAWGQVEHDVDVAAAEKVPARKLELSRAALRKVLQLRKESEPADVPGPGAETKAPPAPEPPPTEKGPWVDAGLLKTVGLVVAGAAAVYFLSGSNEE